MASWDLGADILLATLLVGTIFTAVRLEGALRIIRRDRGAFETLIVNLSSATESVKAGIQALREEADRAALHIGRSSQEADKMATDLSFLIEAADRAGARLEQQLRPVRPEVVVPVPEGKAARAARTLREGVRLPQARRSTPGVEPPLPAEPAQREAPPPAATQAPRLGSLFQQAGITARPRPLASATGLPDALPPASAIKKMG